MLVRAMTAAGKASKFYAGTRQDEKDNKNLDQKGRPANQVHPRADDGSQDLVPAGPHDSPYRADDGPGDQAQPGNRHGHPEPLEEERQAVESVH